MTHKTIDDSIKMIEELCSKFAHEIKMEKFDLQHRARLIETAHLELVRREEMLAEKSKALDDGRWCSSAPVPIADIPGLVTLISQEESNFTSYHVVYFLVNRGEVVYVGQSKRILGRLSDYDDKEFSSVFFIRVPSEKAIEIERQWIIKLAPKYNKDSYAGYSRKYAQEAIACIGEESSGVFRDGKRDLLRHQGRGPCC